MRKTLKKNETGITLVALVVTIIVLLILATVSINLVLGENGIITRSTNAKDETTHQIVAEKVKLEHNEYYIDFTTNKIADTFLAYLNKKSYMDDDGIVNIEELCGQKLAFGNGSIDTGDVYVIVKNDKDYVLSYFDSSNEEKELCKIPITSISKYNYNDELKNIRVGDYIEYFVKEGDSKIGRVLYDANSQYGLQVMLLDPIEDASIEYQEDTLQGWIDIYNNAIFDFVEASKNAINPKYAISSRPLGTNPLNPYFEGDIINLECDNGTFLIKEGDDNYIYDVNVLTDLGYDEYSFNYISRYSTIVDDSGGDAFLFGIYPFKRFGGWFMRRSYGELVSYVLYDKQIKINPLTVITLREDLNITGGNGSESRPYCFHPLA